VNLVDASWRIWTVSRSRPDSTGLTGLPTSAPPSAWIESVEFHNGR